METKNAVDAKEKVDSVLAEVSNVVMGKKDVVENIMIAILCDGHVLLEGVPGIAKTKMANAIASSLACDFKRVQFTPDLLPADILGTMMIDEKKKFVLRQGPIFTNILLADEINRSPPKTQSALLECMQEKQVTIDKLTYPMSYPFIVIATENPIEMEGTYPLPEAQMDRFIFKLILDYPTKEDEMSILRLKNIESAKVSPVLAAKEIMALKEMAKTVKVTEPILEYITDIVTATRQREEIQLGASPRASIAFLKAARVKALLANRPYVIPDDVKEMAYPVLRHRIILKTESELSGITVDLIIRKILETVPVPKV
ncbi:MAG: MoxR family ATPase [Candidatus Micrarchaeota archaeon]|nr:MoxR family ATPase [Candidatus Micrarchaeota archaeon]